MTSVKLGEVLLGAGTLPTIIRVKKLRYYRSCASSFINIKLMTSKHNNVETWINWWHFAATRCFCYSDTDTVTALLLATLTDGPALTALTAQKQFVLDLDNLGFGSDLVGFTRPSALHMVSDQTHRLCWVCSLRKMDPRVGNILAKLINWVDKVLKCAYWNLMNTDTDIGSFTERKFQTSSLQKLIETDPILYITYK